jgi:hypothetical protein
MRLQAFPQQSSKLHNARGDLATGDQDFRHSDGQTETPRTCAAWVDIDHSFATLDLRLVRVPGNDHLNTGGRRHYVELRKVVDYVHVHTIESEQFGLGKRLSPGAFVIVATNRTDWRDS